MFIYVFLHDLTTISPGWPRVHYVDQTGVKFTDRSLPAGSRGGHLGEGEAELDNLPWGSGNAVEVPG